jgi:hypothetical protein
VTGRQLYARLSQHEGFAVASGAGQQSWTCYLNLSRPVTTHEATQLLGQLGLIAAWYTSGYIPTSPSVAWREMDGDVLDVDEALHTLASSRAEVAA